MIVEIENLVDRYRAWLKDKTQLREVNDHVEITTPFLDRHNDYIQIYVKKENGGFLLTDDGYTVNDLSISGCSLESPKRQDLLRVTLGGFGVTLDRGALVVHANSENFSIRKHNLIQAIISVNDLFYLSQPYIQSFFFEDVAAWLDEIDARYTSKVRFSGKSGYDHMFDFVIPKSRNAPERMLRVVNNPNKEVAQSIAFSWVDIQEVRPKNAIIYAVLNDREKNVPAPVEDALKSYGILPMRWSSRYSNQVALAA